MIISKLYLDFFCWQHTRYCEAVEADTTEARRTDENAARASETPHREQITEASETQGGEGAENEARGSRAEKWSKETDRI